MAGRIKKRSNGTNVFMIDGGIHEIRDQHGHLASRRTIKALNESQIEYCNVFETIIIFAYLAFDKVRTTIIDAWNWLMADTPSIPRLGAISIWLSALLSGILFTKLYYYILWR